MTEEERSQRRRKRVAILLLLPLLLGAGGCFWTLFASATLGEAESFIPAPLGSDALADYGEDEIPGRLRSLSIRIVEAVIRDRDPEEADAGGRATDVSESLKSPVPSVTPKPGDSTAMPTTVSSPDLLVTGTTTATGLPSPSAFPSDTLTATQTAGPTSTFGPSPTPSQTQTPTPSQTPTPTPSKTPTPTTCKVMPELSVKLPANGTIYNPGDDIEGHAHAWDPDNVNPSNCSPMPEVDAEGIIAVEFRVKHLGISEYVWTEFSPEYCAFGGGSPCNAVSVNGGIWPNSTPMTGGDYKMWARARDDEGQWSLWEFTTFTINLPSSTPAPSLTPSPTHTPTPLNTPTWTPIPPTATDSPPTSTPDVCSLVTIDKFSVSGGNFITWDIHNNNSSALTMTNLTISWPVDNGALIVVKIGGSPIWSGNDSPPSANLSLSGSVPVGGPKRFRLEYANSVEESGYSGTVTFGTCSISISG